MCVESRGHESPHREPSKIDAVVPQLQFGYGYMGDWGPLTDSVFPCGSRHLLWSHPRDDGARLQEDGHALRCRNSLVGAWLGVWTFFVHGDKEGVLQLPLDKVAKECRLERQDWQILRQCHRHRAIRAMEQRRKVSPQYVDLLEHIWQFSKTKSRLSKWQHTLWCSMDSHEIECEKGHTNDSVREGSWTNTGKRSCHWVNMFSLAVQEQMLISSAAMGNRPLAGTRHTEWWASDRHSSWSHEKQSSSTPSSRTIKMGASSVERNALHTVVPTSECEEPIEAGTLPKFIKIPTAPTTKNPKSETLVSTPGDAEQSTKRRRQEVTFQEPQPTSLSSSTVADTSMQISDHRYRNLHVRCLRWERRQYPKTSKIRRGEHSVGHFRWWQQNWDFNVDEWSESIAHCESEWTSHHGQVWCGGGGRQTAVATSLSTRWVSEQRLDGSYMRLVARGFEQTVSSDTDFFAGTPKVTTLRSFLTIAAIHWNPVAFGDCHSAFHQSPIPIESEPVYVEQAPEAQLDTSKVWLCKKTFQCSLLLSDLSTHVKKRSQRSEDSILLRHMDDVVGTGPDEHLMSDFWTHEDQSVFDRCGGVAQWRRHSQLFGSWDHQD